LKRFLLISLAVLVIALLGWVVYRTVVPTVSRVADRHTKVLKWLRQPGEHPEWAIQAGEKCGDAPFQMPTSGFIGYLWDDSFRLGHRHQGLDIFGGGDVNVTPVYTVYPGYLTRLPEWKSTVIIRIPDDPLVPGRQIWTYYTHMADSQGNSLISPEFPAGTHEVFVKAGTLLGNQGNYSGDAGNPVGVHLHFSIVRDDGNGRFLNELEIENTLDPSPYFNLPLNGKESSGSAPVCQD
jgi:peptidoglycan LD-endopeptidase LytH